MEFGVNGFESVPGDVGVDLSSGNIGMAEKFLDNAQVRAALEEMRRERMAKRMRSDGLSNAGKPCVFFDHLPHELPRQPFPASAQKKMIGLGLLL